jgi:hypothetical protein
MKCERCGNELRLGNEQVAFDENKNPVIHQFAYCDNCRMKWDLSMQQQNYNNMQDKSVPIKKRESVCGIIGMILSFVSCSWIIAIPAIILCIIGVCSKNKKSVCGAIGIVFTIVMFLIGILAPTYLNYVKEAKEENQKTESEIYNTTSNLDSKENTNDIYEYNDNFITVGESFDVSGLKITFNECDLDFTDYDDEYGWYAPDDNKKYVMASFTYNNESNSDKYVSIYDFTCYADGTVCEQSYYFDTDFINANISSGRNVSFRVFYLVPVDCNEIELEYETNLWTGEKQIIKLQ